MAKGWKLEDMAELCLGTVQFGMEYGVNNTLGQPSLEDSFQMLDTAINSGIDIIDTARAYGTAELILGQYFEQRKNQSKVKVISKLSPNVINEEESDVYSAIRRECEESLSRLHLDKLDGYLLHTPQYINNTDIISSLTKLKEEKIVDHIGVSIYEIKDGFSAINTGVIDYIQLPYSILDQRGLKENFIPRAKASGITIFSRSAFLQGLFLMEKERIPANLKESIPYILTFESLLEKYQIDKISALIKFVTMETDIGYLVFGVDTNKQLLEDIEKYKNAKVPIEFIKEVKESFHLIDKSIIFPSLWSNGKKAK